MKKQQAPTAGKLTVLRQLCNYIPPYLVPRLARETGVDEKARTFSPWSHVVSLGYAQLTHSIGLNDVCDALQLNSGPLSAIRGRDPADAEQSLPCQQGARRRDGREAVLGGDEVLGRHLAGFCEWEGRQAVSAPVQAEDSRWWTSTTIQLIASCMDWAKHRRRKAAAKCHLRLDLQSFLPRFAIIDTAREADAKRAREVCAGVKEGEIVIFDKAYVDFDHLWDLEQRGGDLGDAGQGEPAVRGGGAAAGQAGRQGGRRRVGRVEERRIRSRGLSGADAAGGGVGGGGRQGAPDDVPDQPADLESGDASPSCTGAGGRSKSSSSRSSRPCSWPTFWAPRQRGAVAGLDRHCWSICCCATWPILSNWAHSFSRLFADRAHRSVA